MDVVVEAFAEYVLAEEAVALGLADGIQQQRPVAGVLGAHVDVAVRGAHDIAGDDHGLDEVERIILYELAVLEGRCLAFIGIADDDFLFALDGAGLRPFASHGILRATTAADLGLGYQGSDTLRIVHGHRLAQCLESPDAHIGIDGAGVVLAEILGEKSYFAHFSAPSLF